MLYFEISCNDDNYKIIFKQRNLHLCRINLKILTISFLEINIETIHNYLFYIPVYCVEN